MPNASTDYQKLDLDFSGLAFVKHIPLKILLSVFPMLSVRTSNRLTAFSKSSSTDHRAVYHKNHKTLTGLRNENSVSFSISFHYQAQEGHKLSYPFNTEFRGY